MTNLRITLDKLPRILKREWDDGANALNGFTKSELPAAPKLKMDRRNLVDVYRRATEGEDNGVNEIYKTSALSKSILGPIDIHYPLPNDIAECEKFDRHIRPKLEKVLWILREGMDLKIAALGLGLDYDTLSDWVNNNTFNMGVCANQARQEHRIFHVTRTNSSEYGWQASTWMLERKYKDEFSKEVKIKTSDDSPKQKIKFGDREIEF